MKLDSCRLSGAYNFESVSIFVDKLYIFLYSNQHLMPKKEFFFFRFSDQTCDIPSGCEIRFYSKPGKIEPSIF